MVTRSWIVPGPREEDLTGVERLRVQLVAGRVEVEGHDADHVHVAVEGVSGNPLELRQEDGALSIGYPFLGWDGWWKRLTSYRSRDTAQLRILVPRTVHLTVGTAVAGAVVRGLAQDVSLATASGRLRLEGARGAATLRTASGPAEVLDHDGPVRVSSAAGRVDVEGHLPRVEVTTAAGAVSLATRTPTSVVDLSTVSGAMDVRLPTGTGLSLTARTLSGAVRVDGVDRRGTGLGPVTVQDRAGEEVCWLSTRSVSGALTVQRAVAEAAGSPPPDAN